MLFKAAEVKAPHHRVGQKQRRKVMERLGLGPWGNIGGLGPDFLPTSVLLALQAAWREIKYRHLCENTDRNIHVHSYIKHTHKYKTKDTLWSTKPVSKS